MAGSPTQRSLAALRAADWLCAAVEHWNPHAMRRVDLYGFVDILAVKPGMTLAVQTTTASNVAARVAKIRESPHLARVLAAGWRVEVHGWARPTKTIRTWRQRVVPILAGRERDGS
jgi:carbonic anhydrase